MAKATDTSEIDELAFRLYAERIAKMPAQVNGEESSKWAYRKAADFIAIRDRIRDGESTAERKTKLSEVSAPNLKPTHPHNLVSQRFCDANGGEEKVLARVKAINAWLLAHPRSDENPVALDQLDRFDPSTRFDWDVPTTNLARVLLPNYVSN